ncbi:ArsR/SmtB family transcription factor [Aestuariispira insulae]|uniref:ArsR family transcriptional regulator n=1 Tax=Aestuariispira insulae TaxID=1461337 RepID=A0A3D9HUE6_9PROT|nr:metalloregulator ArsR/SmtB family transcription factor [Aestuariispira insulae]RED52506.1 ArsR family transcriptional regulator [Aestuariispira insulae]
MKPSDMEANVRQASLLLKAMSNEKRLMVLCYLSQGEMSVGALEKVIGVSQSALSQHLARLRRDGFVQTRREAQTIYYSLRGEETIAVIGALHDLYCAS